MSLQLQNPYTHQPKQQPFACTSIINKHGDNNSTNNNDAHVIVSNKPIPITLNLFYQSPRPLELLNASLDPDHGQFLNLKGNQKRGLEEDQHHHALETMGRSNFKNGTPKLDLRLNLSPPRREVGSASRAASVSPPSSCVSSDGGDCNSPEGVTSMVLVGCPRCLMYVMLSQNDPKCPKCKSTVLLDFSHDNNNFSGNSKKTRKG